VEVVAAPVQGHVGVFHDRLRDPLGGRQHAGVRGVGQNARVDVERLQLPRPITGYRLRLGFALRLPEPRQHGLAHLVLVHGGSRLPP